MHPQTSPRPLARPASHARHALPGWGRLVPRGLGALAVLAVGAIHLQQYYGPYSAIPTIGELFVVNFVAALVIGVALLAPLEHVSGRWGGAVVGLATVSGIALAGGSFVLLLVSERRPLFGFQEPGYDPTAIALSRVTEIAAVVLLTASLIARFAARAPKPRWSPQPPTRSCAALEPKTPNPKEMQDMKRLPTSAAIVAAALALGACGSSGDDNGGTSTAAPANGSDTVSVEHVDGVGDVLFDQNGMALYTPAQESNGKVLCTDACEAFWKPLKPGSGTPTAEAGVAHLAVIMRPDGTRQVTDDGKPLYTFTEDSQGKVTGNDFSDDFNGQQFTWHAVLSDKSATGSSGGSTGSGMPSTSSGNGGY